MDPSLSCTKDGSTVSCDGSEASNCRLTVQERLDLSSDSEMLTMPTFRLDPEKPFGELSQKLLNASIHNISDLYILDTCMHTVFAVAWWHLVDDL